MNPFLFLLWLLQVIIRVRMAQETRWGKPAVECFRRRWYPTRTSRRKCGGWKGFGRLQGVMKSNNGVVNNISHSFLRMRVKDSGGEGKDACHKVTGGCSRRHGSRFIMQMSSSGLPGGLELAALFRDKVQSTGREADLGSNCKAGDVCGCNGCNDQRVDFHRRFGFRYQ